MAPMGFEHQWTGLPRHDNDRRRPRTTAEIYALNRAMAEKMEEVFLRKGIPVVPSIGTSSFYLNVLSIYEGCPPWVRSFAGNNDVWRRSASSFVVSAVLTSISCSACKFNLMEKGALSLSSDHRTS